MSNGFITYFLVHDGGASPALHKHLDRSLQQISSTPLSDDHTILLQSGFSKLCCESQIPLSPALQLNGDLAGFDDKQLRCFAEAERIRKNQASFSSYTIEPDNRLCVISNNSQSLNRFLDTYGGILDLTPLLVKESHPDFSQITDLAVSSNGKGWRMEYSIRSPVDQNKCSYCGLCGGLCPETCISETVFFDFETCSFCRECEKVCPTGAIDIYAAEQKVLEAPAILALGDTAVQGTEASRNYYRDEDLERYFATLYPSQLEEVITCNHAICQFSSRGETGCDQCLQVCAFEALKGDEKIVIDAFKCTECGRCAGICPTGAIQYQRFADSAFIEFFRTFHLKENTVVVLGTEQELHSFWWAHRGSRFDNHLFLEYPRLNALSALHFIFLLFHGASHVVLLEDTADTKYANRKTVDQANGLIEALLNDPSRVSVSTVQDYPANRPTTELKALLPRLYRDLTYTNRRQKLSSLVQHALADHQETIILDNDGDSLFHTIACDEAACTQCLACLNECAIQALTADPSALTLLWTGGLCTGCTSCVDVCPENALKLGKKTHLNHQFFQPAIAAQAEPVRCRECGKVFGTKKSFARVMEILAKQKMAHDGYFEYCEDCRVIKLFESEQHNERTQ